MNDEPSRASAGFTLVELLVVTTISMLLLVSLSGFERVQMFAMREQETRLDAQASLRAAVDVMVREIRMAGFDLACPRTIAPLTVAQPDALVLQADWDRSGALDPGEQIRYALRADRGVIERQAQGDAGARVAEVIADVSSPVIFRYFDAAGVETANLADIVTVRVDIRITKPSPHPDGVTNITSSIEAEVSMRNAALPCEA